VPGMAELQRLVQDAARTAGGYRNLARRTGGLVSVSTLNNIATGRHSGRLTDDSIRGIALAIGRPADDIARITGTELTDELPPFVLPKRANRLTQPQRRVIVSVVDAILSAADTAGHKRPARAVTDAMAARRVARQRPDG
jgi:hypothetical protein